MHQKVIVYVDGFNFYYGLKADSKWKKYYWLDMVALFEKFLRPDQEIVALNISPQYQIIPTKHLDNMLSFKQTKKTRSLN